MNSIKDFLASIGVIALLVLGMTAATAGVQQINKAFDRQQASQDAMIAAHKAYLASKENVNDIDDDVTYYASEQYTTGQRANQFLAKAYGRE